MAIAKPTALHAEAARLYLSGKSLRQTADAIGVSSPTVLTWLRKAGIPTRADATNSRHTEIQSSIVAAYVSGVSLEATASHFGVSVCAVAGALRRSNTETRHDARGLGFRDPNVMAAIVRKSGTDNPNYIDLPIDEIVDLYRSGKSTRTIGKIFGVGDRPIAARLKTAGVRIRHQGWHRSAKCKDGHIVASTLEMDVDDWLFSNGIEHSVGPVAPWWTGGSSPHRADFKVGDAFIEVWGVTHSDRYNKKRAHKERKYAECNAKLIGMEGHEVSSGDFSKLLVFLAGGE